MTCQHCGFPAAERIKRPARGIIETICPRCGRMDQIKLVSNDQPKKRRGLEEPVCSS